MKLIGDLKKQVDNAKDISKKRIIIEKAGMKLNDDELDMVAGGTGEVRYCNCEAPDFGPDQSQISCSNCGGRRQEYWNGADNRYLRIANSLNTNRRK